MVPDMIKDAVPEGFRERRAAQFLGVGNHLYRGLVKDDRILLRLLGKTRIDLRQDLEEIPPSLPVDRMAQLPADRKGSLPVDGRALKMPSQDPARLYRKEDSLGH